MKIEGDTYFTTIENGEHEIDIEVDFLYNPHEEMTYNYPGCPESVELEQVRLADGGGEIGLLNEDWMEEQILDFIHTHETIDYDYDDEDFEYERW